MASKIHSASGGVSACQALDVEDAGFNIELRASGAMVGEKGHTSRERGVDYCESQGWEEKEFRRTRHSCLDTRVLATVTVDAAASGEENNLTVSCHHPDLNEHEDNTLQSYICGNLQAHCMITGCESPQPCSSHERRCYQSGAARAIKP